MTALAAEGAGAAAGGEGGLTAGLAAGGGMPAPDHERNHSMLLAIGILLLWLAGVAFFIAFEGNRLLQEQADTTGGGLMHAFFKTMNNTVVTNEQANAASEGRQAPPASDLGI